MQKLSKARPLLSMFILKIILQVSHNTKFLSMITWSQTLEEGTTQLQGYSFSWTYVTKKGAACYIGGVVDGRQLVWSAIHDQTATWFGGLAHCRHHTTRKTSHFGHVTLLLSSTEALHRPDPF
uniref:Uncharacterized protein LOC111108854 n=1 Tax=Crassostrea virginica TaxID=6565 RepID=A0A8B8BCE4_CRAVI|nr:uncharacterized protein LOC111108854 [Crassostrea virginica]